MIGFTANASVLQEGGKNNPVISALQDGGKGSPAISALPEGGRGIKSQVLYRLSMQDGGLGNSLKRN